MRARMIVLLCCLAWPAFAAPDDELGHAEFHRALGRSNAGDYQGAIKEYRAAYDLRQDKLQILLNIGDCLEHLASTATQPEEVLRYKLQALDEYKNYVELFEKYDPSHIRPPKGVVRIERLEREIEELRQQQREREEAAARRSEERVQEWVDRVRKAEAERAEAQARVQEMLSERNIREALMHREQLERERQQAKLRASTRRRRVLGIAATVCGLAAAVTGASMLAYTRAREQDVIMSPEPNPLPFEIFRSLRTGYLAGSAVLTVGVALSAGGITVLSW